MTKPLVSLVLMGNGHGAGRPDHNVGDIYRNGLSYRIHNSTGDIIGAAEILAQISRKPIERLGGIMVALFGRELGTRHFYNFIDKRRRKVASEICGCRTGKYVGHSNVILFKFVSQAGEMTFTACFVAP